MKLTIKIFLIFICIFSLISCTASTNTTPTISVKENIVSWEEVTDAKSYLIFINNVQVEEVYSLNYELKLKEGTYFIKVKAKLKEGYSSFSNEIEYFSDGSFYEKEKYYLESPLIKFNNNTISWKKVNHATSYNIYINNEFYTNTKKLEYMFAENIDAEIYIIAVDDTNEFLDSKKSNVLTLKKDSSGSICIFSINDTHGAIITDDSVVGMEKVQSVIKELEKDYNYIKVANGDIFQGGYASNKTYGKIFIDVLNAMDFDCFVIGNHEFDWGLDKISVYNDGILENGEADFPFLSANIVDKDTYLSPDWLEPYTIVENNGFKVGIIGVIGEDLTSSISAEYVEDYVFLDPIPIVENLSKKLREEFNCDSVIVAAHEYSSSSNERYAELSNDSRIDAILCAHTHQKVAEYETTKTGYRIPVLQSNTKNYTVGSIKLNLSNGIIDNTTINHYSPSTYQSDDEILNIIEKYRDIIIEGDEIIGYTKTELSKSKLGNIAANAIRDYSKCDFACLNTGGVRSTIDSGDILLKEVYEVFPFDNNIIKVTMTAQQLINFYNYTEGYLYFSNNLDISNLTKNSYTIGVVDYVYTYPYYERFFKGLPYEELNSNIKDAVIWYLKEEA